MAVKQFIVNMKTAKQRVEESENGKFLGWTDWKRMMRRAMAKHRKEENVEMLVEQEDREAVLAVISANPSVTVEDLLHQLSWMRWGRLFSILGDCRQEGLVTLCQKEWQFEVRAIHPLRKERDKFISVRTSFRKAKRPKNWHLTHS
jgi:hypothetical protein